MILTKKQAAALAFIKQHVAEHGEAPSYAEMMVGLNVTSKSMIANYLSGLEERGAIKRLRNRRRGIEVIDPKLEQVVQAAQSLLDNIKKETRDTAVVRAADVGLLDVAVAEYKAALKSQPLALQKIEARDYR